MLVSFLIPTRQRCAGLYKTLKSIYETASSPKFNVLLYVDTDDHETGDFCKTLQFARLEVMRGPRKHGYNSMSEFCTELAKLSYADWLFIFNDDSTIEGDWMTELAKVPLEGHLTQPQFNRLDESMYENVIGGPFPAVPREAYWRLGYKEIPFPPDTQFDQQLRKDKGWNTWFLRGVTVNHQRKAAILSDKRQSNQTV